MTTNAHKEKDKNVYLSIKCKLNETRSHVLTTFQTLTDMYVEDNER